VTDSGPTSHDEGQLDADSSESADPTSRSRLCSSLSMLERSCGAALSELGGDEAADAIELDDAVDVALRPLPPQPPTIPIAEATARTTAVLRILFTVPPGSRSVVQNARLRVGRTEHAPEE
jgi:hypothetical protein